MSRPRHRPPPWWLRNRLPVSMAVGALIVVLVVVVAAAVGPRPHVDQSQPFTAAPTGEHTTGTKPWPAVTIPTIGAPGAWDPTSPSSTRPLDRTDPPRCSRCGDRTPAAATTTTTPPPPPAAPAAPAPAAPAPAVAGQEAAAADPQPPVAVELLALVNTDRATAGCAPVALHPSLNTQTQAWSNQQAADDTMHHSPGPTGFATWGENVAYGYDTAAAVHTAWMNSPGHRANILNCTYTLMGAAAADSATGVRYWTEQFAA